MKNVVEIKKEAKEQIIKLLNMCGCYTHTEAGIDKWLDTWEKACSPQIEAIAEKSPYYDGKCKIVFPSEYPRGINTHGIRAFCDWLKGFHLRNLEPVKINGYTKQEAKNMYQFYKNLNEINFHCVNIDSLPENMKEIITSLSNVINSNEYWSWIRIIDDAWYRFRNSRNLELLGEHCYKKDEVKSSGTQAALMLASLLNESCFHTQFLDKRMAETLNYHFDKCKFSSGQKLSRAVNMIATKYGIKNDPEWEKEFAKYADSINPLMVTKWTVLSWHPIDYLTFCFGNSWSSCSNIDKHNNRGVKIGSSRSSITSYVDEDFVFRGEHASAALSYMFDKTSFIYYTVSHKYDGTHYEEQDKESRIVFSLNENMNTLLQSRLYPQCHDDNPDDSNYRIPREIVQKVIADALGVPNLWVMKKGSSICSQYGLSTGVHYPDYTDSRNKNCNVSWLSENPEEIHIGHDAICPNCGITHTYLGSLNCRSCDPDLDY